MKYLEDFLHLFILSRHPTRGDIYFRIMKMIFDDFGKKNEKWDNKRQVFAQNSFFSLKNHLFSTIQQKIKDFSKGGNDFLGKYTTLSSF